MKNLNLTVYRGVVIAQYYNTTVAVIDKEGARFSHGGWVTRSTCKAINKALKAAGLTENCYIKQGIMYANERMVQNETI